MLVVSDTSCISNLYQISKLNLLTALFQSIIIPPAVYDELARFHTGELLLHLNDYNISVKEVSNRALISATALKGIDTGEAEAIALSVELKPDFLLIDEKEGKMVANEMGIRTIGILGIILLAKQQKLLAAAGPVFDALRSKTKFYFSDSLYNFLLEQAGEN